MAAGGTVTIAEGQPDTQMVVLVDPIVAFMEDRTPISHLALKAVAEWRPELEDTAFDGYWVWMGVEFSFDEDGAVTVFGQWHKDENGNVDHKRGLEQYRCFTMLELRIAIEKVKSANQKQGNPVEPPELIC